MQVEVVRVPHWTENSWLIHGFSTRPGGKTTAYGRPDDLNLGFTDSDERSNVAANRRLFMAAAAAGKEFRGMVTLRQIHSNIIHRVGANDIRADDQSAALQGDGLMTDEPGVLLGIQTADCIPVLLADLKKRAVAGFHAGWRGTVAGIVEIGVGRMRTEFASSPEDLVASIGPGIGGCCYSVGQEVRQKFESEFNYAAEMFHSKSTSGSAWHLDLAEANRRQLLTAGLKGSSIAMTGHCTGCHTNLYFSHRIEKGFTGRLMSLIGIAASEA